MRVLNIPLKSGEEPVYRRIADSFRELFRDGTLPQGSLLPSTRDLAGQFQVHRHTVTRALEDLIAEGWLESEPGRGFRVVYSKEQEFESEVRQWPEFPLLRGLGQAEEDRYDFPSGKPDLRLFPDEFFRVLRGCLRDIPPETLLGYSDPSGSPSLRRQLAGYLARMRGLVRGQVMVTHGSQEAIFLLGQLLAQGKRKTIAVAELGYPPAWDALRLSGADLVGIPVDKDGLCVDSLEKLAKKNPPALLYLTPLHQYPTTVTLSLARRRKLLEIISHYQIPVIEDDYDHEFHYQGRPNLPLAGEDQSGLVMYVSTFSKLVYPSARVGFCLVPNELLEALCRLKRATTRQNDLLVQETLARWMEHEGLDRHLRKMRKVYKQRMNTMACRLESMGLAFQRPLGGMSIWVDLGKRAQSILQRCESRGLRLRSGDKYALNDGGAVSRFVRLGFASTTPEEIQTGLDVLEWSLKQT